jgi:hypothetical protein
VLVKIEIESLSDATNAPVVRLPGRRFPGIVIQGDSLKAMFDCVQELIQVVRSGTQEQIEGTAIELLEKIGMYKDCYEQTMKKSNEPLPY